MVLLRSTVLLACIWAAPLIASAQAELDLLTDLRGNIRAMFDDEDVCDRIADRLASENTSSDPLMMGYYGVLTIARGTHRINPFARLGTFNDGVDILEAAIARDPSSVELHFLRLSIQVNVPGFVGYDEQRVEDREFVVSRLHTVQDLELRARIIRFIARAEADGKL
ncbi:MAG: hypothetical protein ABI599_11960 [Flavobacteriales bacterium]